MLELDDTFRGAGSDGGLYEIEKWTEAAGGQTLGGGRVVYQTHDGSPVELSGDGGFVVPTTGVTLRREPTGSPQA